MRKDLLWDTLQGRLEAEMDEKLGYSKYDYKNKEYQRRCLPSTGQMLPQR